MERRIDGEEYRFAAVGRVLPTVPNGEYARVCAGLVKKHDREALPSWDALRESDKGGYCSISQVLDYGACPYLGDSGVEVRFGDGHSAVLRRCTKTDFLEEKMEGETK